MNARWTRIAVATGLALATFACRDDVKAPVAPNEAPVATAEPVVVTPAAASGPTGAIFTTVPDGSIVNENVRYNSKLEVYLDGGPRGGSPQTAAGLDDGFYVFQITDPSGRYLLSQDPARCRVVQVAGGIITKLWKPSELKASGGPLYGVSAFSGTDTYVNPLTKATTACQIADAPTPPTAAQKTDFGPSGQHDSNVDVDYGANGAIVVQMMPYGTTPNPGGVYKAWVSTLDSYLSKASGKTGNKHPLDVQPSGVKGRDAQPCPDFCADADPGFGPPRNLQKTDNFKVKEEARVRVVKVNDLNGNGVRDSGEPTLEGWTVAFVETLGDGTKNVIYDQTTATRTFVPGDIIVVCEAGVNGWVFSFATGGTSVATPAELTGTWYCVQVTVGASNTTTEIAFGNYQPGDKNGYKFHDLNANGVWNSGEPGLAGWTINLTGTDGKGSAVSRTTTTDANGYYDFPNLAPGSYTAAEVCPASWYQSYPTPTSNVCGTGVHSFTIVSGPPGAPDVHANNNFGNYQTVTKSGRKLHSISGTGIQGWAIYLLNAAGTSILASTTTDATGYYAFSGLMPGQTYNVCEAQPNGWMQTSPASGADCATYGTNVGQSFAPYGYQFSTVSGVDHPNNDFRNREIQGCTPGFWKQEQWFKFWVTYTPGTLESSPFTHFTGQGGAANGYDASLTMLGALSLDNSNGIGQVLRHGTAALLNALRATLSPPSTPIAFAYTPDEVKQMVNDALDAYGTNQTLIDQIHARLASANEAGCPLGNSSTP